jgi:hypothetical protein
LVAQTGCCSLPLRPLPERREDETAPAVAASSAASILLSPEEVCDDNV